ncbi:uncharacterized protein AMSG_02092 [Thecamonas trahens ATCC 50062]|uniref:Uncharacterized protein n=1 Tax=Thecamonas trahens ATCC 50062 TaxID=461836 RepID=A0A0L0DV47_THETB|nr:hypothetical protein AMSG_02092 [Thecamonas trahens ATCC 50062]KNC56080.1 hypothetical protein AMSG_02092 [Thecamonas trahens ATCC 50062]|eukprot:XP_013761124.1 hypothetical protein AMSG_02092 [Thecamonas trahens ATCC 50062]
MATAVHALATHAPPMAFDSPGATTLEDGGADPAGQAVSPEVQHIITDQVGMLTKAVEGLRAAIGELGPLAIDPEELDASIEALQAEANDATLKLMAEADAFRAWSHSVEASLAPDALDLGPHPPTDA